MLLVPVSASEDTLIVPALIAVAPVYVLVLLLIVNVPVPTFVKPPLPLIMPEEEMLPVLVLKVTRLPLFTMPPACDIVPVLEVNKVIGPEPMLVIVLVPLNANDPAPAISMVLPPLPSIVNARVVESATLAVTRKVPAVVPLPIVIAELALPNELLMPPFTNDETTKTPLLIEVVPV